MFYYSKLTFPDFTRPSKFRFANPYWRDLEAIASRRPGYTNNQRKEDSDRRVLLKFYDDFGKAKIDGMLP